MNRFQAFYFIAFLLLAGCEQVYPDESYFSDLIHYQSNLDEGFIVFEESPAWKGKEAKSNFNVESWMITAVGAECEEKSMHENPIPYRIDLASGIIIFGRKEKTLCRLQPGQDHVDFIIYPVISGGSVFDSGEIIGEAHFRVVLME